MVANETSSGGLSPQQALSQISYLRDLVEGTRMRVADGHPFFTMWGLVWALGFSFTAWSYVDGGPTDKQVSIAWVALIAAAAVGNVLLARFYFARRDLPPMTPLGRQLQRMNVLLAAAGFFVPIFHEFRPGAGSTFWPFWIGVLYLANGLFVGRECFVIGGWLIAATTAALFMPDAVQALWLALAGGGGFVATGLVFRRQVKIGAQRS